MMYQAKFHSRMLVSCLSTIATQVFMGAANAVLGSIDSMIYAALQISDRVYDFFMRPSVKRFRLPARLQYHLAMIWRFWPTLASRFVFVFCWSFVFQFAFQFARLAGYI
jgi:hypothetical protein